MPNFCIQGPYLLYTLVIVVADALIIYSVYNSDVMYKRERNLYKYLHKKNKHLLLKTTWKEEDLQLIKIPP